MLVSAASILASPAPLLGATLDKGPGGEVSDKWPGGALPWLKTRQPDRVLTRTPQTSVQSIIDSYHASLYGSVFTCASNAA